MTVSWRVGRSHFAIQRRWAEPGSYGLSVGKLLGRRRAFIRQHARGITLRVTGVTASIFGRVVGATNVAVTPPRAGDQAQWRPFRLIPHRHRPEPSSRRLTSFRSISFDSLACQRGRSKGVTPAESSAAGPRQLQREVRRPRRTVAFALFAGLPEERFTEPDIFGAVASRRCSRTARSNGLFTSLGSSIGTKFSSGKR